MRREHAAAGYPPAQTIAQPVEELREYIAEGPQIILTDEYAPVDNLISILFDRRG
jgi:hypothetical protein